MELLSNSEIKSGLRRPDWVMSAGERWRKQRKSQLLVLTKESVESGHL